MLFFSTNSEISNVPLKVPMRPKTTMRYVRTITKMIAFVLRAHLKVLKDFELELAPTISGRAGQLLSLLSDGEDACSAVHDLVMVILSQLLGIDAGNKCPGYYFIIFANVLPSGKIRDVEDILETLTEIKWPLRSSTFWEIVQQSRTLEASVDLNK
jgi:hypothetical protein